jgi:uncharacterized protein with HEPN domain
MLDMARKAVSKTQGIHARRTTRTRIVHDYLGVDDDIVWQVVTEDLPQLVAALESIASPAPPPPRATG